MRHPPSIIHYAASLDPKLGGVVAHVCDLAVLCVESGARVRLVTSQADPRPERLDQDPRPEIAAIGRPAIGGKLFSRRQIDRFFEQAREFDVIHLHGTWTPANLQLARRARKERRPYVATPHGMLDDWCLSHRRLKKRLYLAFAGTRYFAGAERVLYCAQGELEQSSPWTGGTPGRVVPAATDLAPFEDLRGPDLARSTIDGAEGDESVVLFLSRIDPKKGLEVLIDAAARLAQGGTRFRLILAGTGETVYVNQLRERVRAAGLAERTFFVGHVSGAEKVSLYQRAACLVLPTKQENFGLVLTESLAAGTPVVTTKGVDIWPELEACGGGVIVDRIPDAFAEAIRKLIDSPDHARAMGQDGRSWVMRELSRGVLAEKFLRIYGEAMG